MWDEVSASTLVILAGVAILGGVCIAFLKKGKARTILIAAWTALPFLIVIAANVAVVFERKDFDTTAFFGFTAVFTFLLLPPWALLTLLPFNLAKRWREIDAGINYRNGS